MSKPCSIEGCEKRQIARGWCHMHWARWRNHGSTDDPRPPKQKRCSVDGCTRPPRSGANLYCEVHYYRLRRTGTTADPALAPERCIVAGCDKPGRYRSGLCRMHHLRKVGRGNLGFRYEGPNHALWVGDNASYSSVHARVRRRFGRASGHKCADCGGRARQWSYNHTGVKEKVEDGCGLYSTDLTQYSPRCVSCHKKFDLAQCAKRRGSE